jgi:uncharacterized radical SAM superfamily Fe-S cluster-containing enzyme
MEVSSKSPGAQPLKQTRTLCPSCLEPKDGLTFALDGKVYLERSCAEHGDTVALVAGSRDQYWLRDEVAHPPPDADACCGTGPQHRSCIALLELTDACNLSCEACYAQSPAGRHHSLDELLGRLDAFLDARGPLDVLQLSGGEPTIHPDFLRILDEVKERPIQHVMVNTNGLRLAQDPELAGELKKRMPRLELYLQMDGLDEASHVALRGRELLDIKRAAIDAIIENDLPTTLVCTVAAGVNEHELGELLRLGLNIPTLRGISYQPATYAGRYNLDAATLERMTVAEVVERIETQTEGLLRADDFKPLPCSDPNCCSFTFAVRQPTGQAIAATRLVDYAQVESQLADRIVFTPDNTGGCCGTDVPSADFFRVVVKPFMDAYTYDQDRVDECCVHIIDKEGEGVSFCEYNVRRRSDELVQIGGGKRAAAGAS